MKHKISEEEIASLKSDGIFIEKDKKQFSVRFLVVGGNVSADTLSNAAVFAKRYGDGMVHLTTRQSFEIPHVPYEKLDAIRKAAAKVGLKQALSGPCVRGITACPGTWCKLGSIDTQATAQAIFRKFAKCNGLPHKFKIAVAGCGHCCSKPQENDLGVMGTGGNYAVFVGGMAGKTPRWGNELPTVIKTRKELLDLIKHVIDWYSTYGSPKERFGAAIEKLGLDNLLNYLEGKRNLFADK
ncbi:NAD(P)/FAD-dependent oxidoreductase [Planctomycetales bacterium]|nr:NAD(P)/FAD-dependent oxidoreductase [Planctomycetales bacterium]GHT38709.1 NAD(P)/FAD-dependent oxidoreductase [Planctomycetales bacterium]